MKGQKIGTKRDEFCEKEDMIDHEGRSWTQCSGDEKVRVSGDGYSRYKGESR